MGKLFSRRAASTIFWVVEGQGLLSRTAACCKRNCISSKFREMSSQCGISGRKNGGVSKKKGYRIFVDGKCVVGARTSPLLRLFNLPVVFISIWQLFKTCLRAAQSALEGRMRPVVCPPLVYTSLRKNNNGINKLRCNHQTDLRDRKQLQVA